jgi:hypothetical protein
LEGTQDLRLIPGHVWLEAVTRGMGRNTFVLHHNLYHHDDEAMCILQLLSFAAFSGLYFDDEKESDSTVLLGGSSCHNALLTCSISSTLMSSCKIGRKLFHME